MTYSEDTTSPSGRMTWQRPSLVRMGAADAEGTTRMSMLTDAARPRRMMSS
jgi:hypothetical protein